MPSQIENNEWDRLQLASGASFFQSAAWGDFQESIGSKQHRLQGSGWSCLLLERQTSLGKYMFAPYGPTLQSANDLATALETIKNISKQTGAIWARIEPVAANSAGDEIVDMLASSSATHAPHNVEPEMTRIVDITPDVDTLLMSLSPKTRTRIRRNQREATISFRSSTSPSDIQIFTNMTGSVASRKGISFFSKEYFQKQAEALMPMGYMQLEIAYHEDKPLGSLIVHYYGQRAYYTYAASLPEARKKDVSELLLWQAILNAKAKGMNSFDLFGIAPPDADSSHPWFGFSTFKEKFGGQIVKFAGTWDIPLSQKYKLYRNLHSLRSVIKRR